MKNSRYEVVVIEPSELLAAGLCGILDTSSEFCVTGVYTDVARYLELPEVKRQADLVIINPALVVYGRKVRSLFPDSKLIALLYNYLDGELLQPFHETIGICDKPKKILHNLKSVMMQSATEAATTEAGELSDREREILVSVAKGMMNKEIADACNISIHTVISHRKNISRKTGIKSVSGFVVYALLNNLLEEYEIQQ